MYVLYICILVPLIHNSFSLIEEETDLNSLSRYDAIDDLNENAEEWPFLSEDLIGNKEFLEPKDVVKRETLDEGSGDNADNDKSDISSLDQHPAEITTEQSATENPIKNQSNESASDKVIQGGDDVPNESITQEHSVDTTVVHGSEQTPNENEGQDVPNSRIETTDPGVTSYKTGEQLITEKSINEAADNSSKQPPNENEGQVPNSDKTQIAVTHQNITQNPEPAPPQLSVGENRTDNPLNNETQVTQNVNQTAPIVNTPETNRAQEATNEIEKSSTLTDEEKSQNEAVNNQINADLKTDKNPGDKQGKTLIGNSNAELKEDASTTKLEDPIKTQGSTPDETRAGTQDATILVLLFVAVLVVGALAFGYNFLKKRIKNNADLERNERNQNKQNVTQGEPEPESKPFLDGRKEIEMNEIKKPGTSIEENSEADVKA